MKSHLRIMALIVLASSVLTAHKPVRDMSLTEIEQMTDTERTSLSHDERRWLNGERILALHQRGPSCWNTDELLNYGHSLTQVRLAQRHLVQTATPEEITRIQVFLMSNISGRTPTFPSDLISLLSASQLARFQVPVLCLFSDEHVAQIRSHQITELNTEQLDALTRPRTKLCQWAS